MFRRPGPGSAQCWPPAGAIDDGGNTDPYDVIGAAVAAGTAPPATAGEPETTAFDAGAVRPPAGAAATGALVWLSGAASGVVRVCGTEVIGGMAPAALDPIDKPLPNCEPIDAGEFGKAPRAATTGQHRHEVDGLGDQRPGDGDDSFRDELLEAAQRAERAARVDRADPARMAGAPGLQEIQRL